MKYFKIIKYVPFFIALLHTILYSILIIGARPYEWIDTSKPLSIWSYGELVYFVLENGYYIDLLFILPLLMIVFLKLLKKEVFLFYGTILLIITNFIQHFFSSYWDPHY